MQQNFVLIISILFILLICLCQSKVIPQQIHLSFGNSPHQMVVTWVTFSFTRRSFVWYGKLDDGITAVMEGKSKSFSVGKRTRFVHKVILNGLEPLNFYVYCCGSDDGVSHLHTFKTIPLGSQWSPRLIIFGDMGWENAVTFPYMIEEAKNYQVDAFIHVGDIAYNMETCDGIYGDKFMRMIEPVACSIPYMTLVGNHEQYCNFTFYKNIFSMPGKNNRLYYSFDIGPVHFVAITTEVYFYLKYGSDPIIAQFKWLEKDLRISSRALVSTIFDVAPLWFLEACYGFVHVSHLAEVHTYLKQAAKIKNRRIRPWIVVLGHRPLYCSSDANEDCSREVNILRCCIINHKDYGLENLFRKTGVDIFFSGHMHYYERSWPIYRNEAVNGSRCDPYYNAKGVVQIITGAAGMKCGTEHASSIRKDWFASYSEDYSYTTLNVRNKTHMLIQQVSASRNGEVIDTVWFRKSPPKNNF